MDYSTSFLSIFLYFFQTYSLFIFIPIVYLIGYFLLRWIGVKTKTLCLGLTFLCVPILFWFLLHRSIFHAGSVMRIGEIVVDSWRYAFTTPPMILWTLFNLLSMAAGGALCAVAMAKKRQQKSIELQSDGRSSPS